MSAKISQREEAATIKRMQVRYGQNVSICTLERVYSVHNEPSVQVWFSLPGVDRDGDLRSARVTPHNIIED